jgi:hypothetical protein
MAEIQHFYADITGKNRDQFDASTVKRR